MSEKNIQIIIVHTDNEYEAMKTVRREVFVEEMGIPESKEFDGNDHTATHIVALSDGKPVGTMRMRFFPNFAKFERMAVIKEFRKSDISDRIMNFGFEHCAEKGYTQIYGVCKKELLSRWKKSGYKRIKDAPEVDQNGMTLYPIMKELPENPEAVSMTSHPAILSAKEGDWKQMLVVMKNETMRKSIQRVKRNAEDR